MGKMEKAGMKAKAKPSCGYPLPERSPPPSS